MAFAVSNYVYRESNYTSIDNRIVRVRAWDRNSQIERTKMALRSAVTSLEYFEQLLDMAYPMDKLDLFDAIDMGSDGAMENPGLITFTQYLYQYGRKWDEWHDKVMVANTVAHEVAHQWFGNLVTMKNWGELFLNEGFATLLSYYPLPLLITCDNEWEMSKDDYIYDVSDALKDDLSNTTRPLSSTVDDPENGLRNEVLFDTIDYGKGSSILRMFENVMGHENFINGLKLYLKTHKYDSADHYDLLKALAKGGSRTVSWKGGSMSLYQFANPWIVQPGFPLVIVDRVNDTHVQLKQKRYIGSWYGSFETSEQWAIPIWHQINGTDQPMLIIKDNSTLLPLGLNDILIVNPDYYGFYLAKYGDDELAKLRATLLSNQEIIRPKGRVKLITDSFQLANDGHLSYPLALDLLKYLPNEDHPLPLLAALEALNGIEENLVREQDRKYIAVRFLIYII
ncbi:peptidase family m1 domain-containing protein [Ditylenchus destructor]|uniref:Peptidase family m1 domain-containing protein n=1 Tax=Ditylenchus destructor TaxID=166010 RepID=A0AAD4MFU5_9BILA|nr:peptidase family m1 domain-containing protein [Ditylenchus destructor]